jgi:uncharacterized protein YjiS (DUF1127 family)
MSTLRLVGGTAFPPRARISAYLHALMRRIVRVGHAFTGRRIVADLARMDDRMLRDIGLSRGDLRDAAAGPLTDDPTIVLFRRAAERRAARERVDFAVKAAERISRKHFVPYY